MVLAAGKATRLRPLTDRIAKPALSFVGEAILDRVLDSLADVGVVEAIVNLHHAAESMRDVVRRRGDRAPFVLWSDEADELLGTGGALLPVRELLAGDDFLLVNGDCVHSIDIAALIADHRASAASATLTVRPTGEPGFGALIVEDGAVVSFGEKSTGRPSERHFLSVQVVSPAVLDHLPSSPRSFSSFEAWYPRARAAGHVFRVHETDAEWHALDSRDLYLGAQRDYLRRRGQDAFIAKDADIAAGVGPIGGGAAIHGRARIARGASIIGSAVLEGAIIEDGALVRDSIIGPGARVPAGREVISSLVAAHVPIA